MSALTSQQIFDAALQQATHLKRSTGINGRDCKYLSSTGNKCFIGALIPNDKYLPEFEGKKGPMVLERLGLITHKEAFSLTTESIPECISFSIAELIEQLQYLHDTYDPPEWHSKFLEVAKQYSLTCNPDHLKVLEAVSI